MFAVAGLALLIFVFRGVVFPLERGRLGFVHPCFFFEDALIRG